MLPCRGLATINTLVCHVAFLPSKSVLFLEPALAARRAMCVIEPYCCCFSDSVCGLEKSPISGLATLIGETES
jgi:hypothetical protein